MDIEFDPNKDAINRAKHGISLESAAAMDLDAALVVPDVRFAYDEPRFQALGSINGRIHLLAYTMRGNVVRAISLRKANDREVKRYEQCT